MLEDHMADRRVVEAEWQNGSMGASHLDCGFSSAVMGFVGVVPSDVLSSRRLRKSSWAIVGVLGKWGNLANRALWWWLVYRTSHIAD